MNIGCDGEITVINNGQSLNDLSCSGSWVGTGGPFDPSTLDPIAVVEAIGSGFIIAGVPFLTVAVCRIILRPLLFKRF